MPNTAKPYASTRTTPALVSDLGIALSRQGRHDESIVAYREAIRLNPYAGTFRCNLGITLARQGKLDEAIAEYREAIRLDPYDARFHINLGLDLQSQGKLDEAIATYREAIRLDPYDATVYANLALLFADAADPQWRQPEEAVKMALKATDLAPQDADFWNTLGVAASPAEKWHEAITATREIGRAGGSPAPATDHAPGASGVELPAASRYGPLAAWRERTRRTSGTRRPPRG